jgi:hypothetical protein
MLAEAELTLILALLTLTDEAGTVKGVTREDLRMIQDAKDSAQRWHDSVVTDLDGEVLKEFYFHFRRFTDSLVAIQQIVGPRWTLEMLRMLKDQAEQDR